MFLRSTFYKHLIVRHSEGGLGNKMAQLEFRDQEIIVDPTKWDNAPLIKCEDEECEGVSFRHEIQMNNWRCPYCGKSISKTQ